MSNARNIKEIIFWGATGQAKVLRECLKDSGIKLVALVDNNKQLQKPFSDVPLLFGKDSFLNWIQQRNSNCPLGFLVAIGGSNGRDRIDIQNYLESYGLVPVIARHPTAFIADDVELGAGSQILAHSSICVESVVGRGCIINTGAIVDHECQLSDGIHIGPGAHLAGCIRVDNFAFIGTGATILPRIIIGENAIVGAGAVVTKDVLPHTVVVGNPAKVLRKIKHE